MPEDVWGMQLTGALVVGGGQFRAKIELLPSNKDNQIWPLGVDEASRELAMHLHYFAHAWHLLEFEFDKFDKKDKMLPSALDLNRNMDCFLLLLTTFFKKAAYSRNSCRFSPAAGGRVASLFCTKTHTEAISQIMQMQNPRTKPKQYAYSVCVKLKSGKQQMSCKLWRSIKYKTTVFLLCCNSMLFFARNLFDDEISGIVKMQAIIEITVVKIHGKANI